MHGKTMTNFYLYHIPYIHIFDLKNCTYHSKSYKNLKI